MSSTYTSAEMYLFINATNVYNLTNLQPMEALSYQYAYIGFNARNLYYFNGYLDNWMWLSSVVADSATAATLMNLDP